MSRLVRHRTLHQLPPLFIFKEREHHMKYFRFDYKAYYYEKSDHRAIIIEGEDLNDAIRRFCKIWKIKLSEFKDVLELNGIDGDLSDITFEDGPDQCHLRSIDEVRKPARKPDSKTKDAREWIII